MEKLRLVELLEDEERKTAQKRTTIVNKHIKNDRHLPDQEKI
jgi:hypothetical protein